MLPAVVAVDVIVDDAAGSDDAADADKAKKADEADTEPSLAALAPTPSLKHIQWE